MPTRDLPPPDAALLPAGLLSDLRKMIKDARQRAAVAVNRELTLLYWHIGRRIRQDILGEERAEYGERIVSTLSAKLTDEYGRGYTVSALSRMTSFAERFPDEPIVATLSQQLSWSHFREIVPIKDHIQREFYAEICRLERWSVRTLRARIQGMLYQRTVLSGRPEAVIQADIDALRSGDQLTPDLVFRDPYLLDFLGLHDGWSEKDLESALVREMERFLLELGAGFSFVARQKRMTVDDEDFYLDLLFYHRKLRRLVAIDLKLGNFTASYKGQMEAIPALAGPLRARTGRGGPRRRDPVRAEKSAADRAAATGRRRHPVAEYFTQNLPPARLEQEMGRAVIRAREQIALREGP